ncbi:3-oxoacyl-[acyl-carrier-protein] synthase III C-terminal domain-containing protein [Halorussus amylolyticus]|uniref:3-oxoacyl-[acyl-carrier-protein] synthase III C-terminal domain-containing protein n=1 Tax=Halorussus amylolyticus TaxID=1126242 RepID=UPI001047B380|nr:3-oxoacyl-[acyl-carrier-protein] synthase III C-terminal domain-containing protein [Halorussus amylolyticus]
MTETNTPEVGLTGFGTYVPDEIVTGEEIAAESGIPEEVVVEKMGVREKRVCSADADHATDMCVKAARKALSDADRDPEDVDLVLYHGSEYKDFVVWSAAANVAERIGADDAFAVESYALCAGAPLAIRQAKSQLLADAPETALLVSASREEDLVDYGNEDSSFMFNFGSGACAMVLESVGSRPTENPSGQGPRGADPADGRTRATVRESAAVTDGSFSEDVVMAAGGSRNPASHATVEAGLHALDVPDPEGMKERLADVSLPNFLDVADDALARSGYDRADLDFVALTHMKRSFHDLLTDELDAESYYLDEYGHVQSVDQILALEEGLDRGLVESGDVLCFLAAGTGYTWAATVLEWRG